MMNGQMNQNVHLGHYVLVAVLLAVWLIINNVWIEIFKKEDYLENVFKFNVLVLGVHELKKFSKKI